MVQLTAGHWSNNIPFLVLLSSLGSIQKTFSYTTSTSTLAGYLLVSCPLFTWNCPHVFTLSMISVSTMPAVVSMLLVVLISWEVMSMAMRCTFLSCLLFICQKKTNQAITKEILIICTHVLLFWYRYM